jgi:hypothetical protein
VLALAMVASVAAGIAARRHPGRRRGALIAVNAVLVVIAFPVRYFEPGTNRVADPQAAPPLAPPRLATPPLVAPKAP